ncbi:MAG: hypothetical protein FRX48_06871 [Lasallia pustulata]|uniref:Uncharacterized protein n=1 Tax=Lasallia pustulata TaxID=136370 RepID=A0A5M8PKC1_9LECA|nr:MAG: hypothetical protein FRX48_06871 [Lasallia pustulata]
MRKAHRRPTRKRPKMAGPRLQGPGHGPGVDTISSAGEREREDGEEKGERGEEAREEGVQMGVGSQLLCFAGTDKGQPRTPSSLRSKATRSGNNPTDRSHTNTGT